MKKDRILQRQSEILSISFFNWKHITFFSLLEVCVFSVLCKPCYDFACLTIAYVEVSMQTAVSGIFLTPTTMFSQIFLRQILKEWFCIFLQIVEIYSKFLSSFHFVILVPKAFEDLLNVVSPVIYGVYILGGGGYGTCNIILNHVFEGIINGATATEGGDVGWILKDEREVSDLKQIMMWNNTIEVK